MKEYDSLEEQFDLKVAQDDYSAWDEDVELHRNWDKKEKPAQISNDQRASSHREKPRRQECTDTTQNQQQGTEVNSCKASRGTYQLDDDSKLPFYHANVILLRKTEEMTDSGKIITTNLLPSVGMFIERVILLEDATRVTSSRALHPEQ